jgi:4-diphosphocytidyl-2-C-methyl-D-erythritol kinase
VFQFLEYSDELCFEILNHNEITLMSSMADVKHEDNLIIKAARLLQKVTTCQFGAQITLNKRLPMGAGLGGGSSDAATTLVALNQLWRLNLQMDQLLALGVQLGADVPVFIQGYSAWAEGIGEELSAIQLDEPWFVIIMPSVHVSTKDVFNSSLLKRNSHPITIAQFLSGQGINVCETVVTDLYPEVKQALIWLEQFYPAKMTGTGASVFITVKNKQEAEKILAQKPEIMDGFIAKGCNISPLYCE